MARINLKYFSYLSEHSSEFEKAANENRKVSTKNSDWDFHFISSPRSLCIGWEIEDEFQSDKNIENS